MRLYLAGFIRDGEGDFMWIVIILLIILFAGGFGYYGHTQWGPGVGGGISIGTILIILLVCYLLGLFK